MDFKNARERYMTNPDFHRLIDTLDDLIWNAKYWKSHQDF